RVVGIGQDRVTDEVDVVEGHAFDRERDLGEEHRIGQGRARRDVGDGGTGEPQHRAGVRQHLLAHDLAGEGRHVHLLVAHPAQVAAVTHAVPGAKELQRLPPLEIVGPRREVERRVLVGETVRDADGDAADRVRDLDHTTPGHLRGEGDVEPGDLADGLHGAAQPPFLERRVQRRLVGRRRGVALVVRALRERDHQVAGERDHGDATRLVRDVQEHVDIVALPAIVLLTAEAEVLGVLRLALVRADQEHAHAALERSDVGRHRVLALQLDGVGDEGRVQVVDDVCGDADTAHQHDGHDDADDLHQLAPRAGAPELPVSCDG
ncbi:hypothetical protein ABE10_01800, partial [Bacillus toyonensis]|nr:hypothetical protein [Bacillus toyonensis]